MVVSVELGSGGLLVRSLFPLCEQAVGETLTDDGLKDPISVLATGAIQVHELFDAYVQAGFTRPEALQLIITILAISISGTQGTGEA